MLCVLLQANVDHSQRFTLIHFSTLKFSFIGCLTNSFLTGLVGEGVPASQKFIKRVIDAGSLWFANTPNLVLRQNCSDDSTEVTEGVTSTNKHSFVLTFFATNASYVNCKRCKL